MYVHQSSNSIIHPNIMGLRGKKSKASVEGDLNKSLPFCRSAVFRGLFGHGSAWALLWSLILDTPSRNIAPTKSVLLTDTSFFHAHAKSKAVWLKTVCFYESCRHTIPIPTSCVFLVILLVGK